MSVKINTCNDFLEKLNEYMDGELSKDVRDEMERHASSCPDCAETLDRMTQVLTMCAELDEDVNVPLACQAAWRNAVREEAKQKKHPRIGAATRTVTAAAAVLVLLLCGTMLLRDQGTLVNGTLMKMPETSGTEAAYKGAAMDELQDIAGRTSLSSQQRAGSMALESDGSADSESGQSPVAFGSGADNAGGAKAEVIILRSARRTIETSDYDADADKLNDLVDEYEAYFETHSVEGSPILAGEATGRTAYMIIRVPSAKLDEFLSALDAVGEITLREEQSEDISASYTDTQARITSLRAQLDKLNKMNESARNVEDLIAIDEKTREVTDEIESLEGNIKDWNSRASFARVTLTVTEVAGKDHIKSMGTTLNERVANSFHDSVNWLVGFLQDALVVLAMVTPQLVIWIPAAVLVIIILRVIVKGFRGKRR